MKRSALAVLLAAGAAHAETPLCERARDRPWNSIYRCENQTLAKQLQLDLGLGVIGIGFELPIASHLLVQLEATGFSTFYLPLIGGGVNVLGAGGSMRATWVSGNDGRGLFVTPVFRFERVGGEKETGETGHGFAEAAGITIGQAFRVTPKLDLRVGFGGQMIHYRIPTAGGTLTATVPFLALDLVVGYRL
ncbi:hypothetical protein BH11MYX3_BH11MYX3_26330 [soil metagenome]